VSTDGTAIKIWSPCAIAGFSSRSRAGDRDDYTIEQEFSDATVVNTVAARTGPVALWGTRTGPGPAARWRPPDERGGQSTLQAVAATRERTPICLEITDICACMADPALVASLITEFISA
jgi:hypothetical protein